MANETILNYLNKTVINGENSNKSLPIFKIGDVFDKKYEVIEVMSYIDSGEADLYKVKKLSSDEILVLKIYRRENAIKDDVLKKITLINNINVGKILDSGKIDRFAYIVTPFYKVGSLENIISQNIKFKTDMLKSIIKSLNEGINAIHSVGIFHKDVKPANMMISDDGSHVILIDFGISSATNGRTVVATQTGKTPFYSAPETNLGLFSKESDYYSLGISLYELITGFTPFQNINIDDLAKYQQISKIPFTDDFDEEFKRLIIGLTYNDITNRNVLDNPNRRWGYQEVNKWLNGEKVPLPGESQAISANNQLNQVSNNNARFSRPFVFKGVKYFDLKELAEALLLNWNDGQDVLFRGKLAMHFDLIENVELQKLCEYAEKWCEKNEDNKDQIFFECIYQFSSDITSLYWHGAKFESVYNFGEELSKAVLENKNEHYLNFVEEPLLLDCLKWYASYVGENYEENERIINYIHMLFKHEGIKSSYKALKIGNLLTGQSKIKIGNRIFNSVECFNEFITKLQENKNIQEEDKSVLLSYKNDFLMLKQLYASIKKVKSVLFEVGSTVSFGGYENQPIEWQVLEVKDNKALLLSKHILFRTAYDKNHSGIWKTSSLRQYLNGEFYENCFTKIEKNAIISSFTLLKQKPL
jgi:serine/threonine protein kinase